MIDLKGYFLRFTAFSAILFVLSAVFKHFADNSLISEVFLLLVPFFYFAGLISWTIFVLAARRNNKHFSLVYLITTTARLMIYISIMVGYCMLFRDDAYRFLIGFFVFYVFYTLYEVISLYKKAHS